MAAYHWPGNIRELKNVIERICIMYPGPVLVAGYLPHEIGRRREEAPSLAGRLPGMEHGLELATEMFEKALIAEALRQTAGNVLQAAQLLQVPRGTLRYKMGKYGLG